MPMTMPDLLTVVVTHDAPGSLITVLKALGAQAPAQCTAVLYTGSPDSPAADRACAAAHLNASALLPIGTTARIGTGRGWLLDHLQRSGAPWKTIAFLDDDCAPRPGWWAAALRFAGTADLVFGPRHPRDVQGSGGHVRAWEARGSAKLLAAGGHHDPIISPRMMVAGGNMLLDIAAAQRLGVTDPAFARGAFEDVDYQLRLGAAGGTILFVPDLAVDHHDRLDGRDLVRKSVLSGVGLARCVTRHGSRLWWCCRWRPARMLVTAFGQLAPFARCPLTLRLRALALTRAMVLFGVYVCARLRYVLMRRTRNGRRDTPVPGRCVRCGGELCGAPFAPAQQASRVMR